MPKLINAIAIIACAARISHAQIDSVPCIYSDFVSITAGLVEGEQIEIDGDYAYISDGGRGLKIYSIADPTAPQLIGEYPTINRIRSLAKQGNTIALTIQRNYVLLLDVSDPATPTYLGATIDTPRPLGVSFIDNHLFVTEEFAGLAVFDLSTPATPARIASLPLTRPEWDITEHNGLVYISAGRDGIYIVNAQDPLHPALVSTIPTDDATLSFKPVADLLYRNDESAGLSIFDISDPLSPQLLATAPADIAGFAGVGLEVINNRAIIADFYGGIRVINCSDPTSPEYLGFYDTGRDTQDVTYHEGLAFVVDQQRGLQIIDVSNPKQPATISEHQTPGWVYAVDLVGDTMYVVDGNHPSARFGTGLQVLDVSNPAAPVELGVVPGPAHPGSMLDVLVRDGFAYVCNGSSGLSIVDVHDPASPSALGSITGITATGVLLENSNAYITTPGGLEIADISDPTNPTIISSIDHGSSIVDIAIDGDRAYLACLDDGVLIFDITDPANPTELAVFDTPEFTESLQVIGGIAYINDYSSFLIADLSSPSTPVQLAQYPFEIHTSGVVRVIGDTAYLTRGAVSLMMFDVSDPTNPIRTGLYQSPGVTGYARAESVVIRDGIAYIANARAGVTLVDISEGCSAVCPADFNADGTLNFFDVSAFLVAYLALEPAADLAGDGVHNFFDVSAFLVSYGSGCP